MFGGRGYLIQQGVQCLVVEVTSFSRVFGGRGYLIQQGVQCLVVEVTSFSRVYSVWW